jgi:hypothetical protein
MIRNFPGSVFGGVFVFSIALGSFGKKHFFKTPRIPNRLPGSDTTPACDLPDVNIQLAKSGEARIPEHCLQRGRPASRLLCTMKKQGTCRFRGKWFQCIKTIRRNRVNRSVAEQSERSDTGIPEVEWPWREWGCGLPLRISAGFPAAKQPDRYTPQTHASRLFRNWDTI